MVGIIQVNLKITSCAISNQFYCLCIDKRWVNVQQSLVFAWHHTLQYVQTVILSLSQEVCIQLPSWDNHSLMAAFEFKKFSERISFHCLYTVWIFFFLLLFLEWFYWFRGLNLVICCAQICVVTVVILIFMFSVYVTLCTCDSMCWSMYAASLRQHECE